MLLPKTLTICSCLCIRWCCTGWLPTGGRASHTQLAAKSSAHQTATTRGSLTIPPKNCHSLCEIHHCQKSTKLLIKKLPSSVSVVKSLKVSRPILNHLLLWLNWCILFVYQLFTGTDFVVCEHTNYGYESMTVPTPPSQCQWTTGTSKIHQLSHDGRWLETGRSRNLVQLRHWKGKLPNEELTWFLVVTDFTESDSFGVEMMRLLHTASGGSLMCRRFSSKLFIGCFATSEKSSSTISPHT